MSTEPNYQPLHGGLLEEVIVVHRIERPEGHRIRGTGVPGHLLRLVVEGEAEEHVCGQTRRLSPGTAVWYWHQEVTELHGLVCKGPWRFYSVNFTAARLPPPPSDRRMWEASDAVVNRFQTLLEAWTDADSPPVVRHMRVHACLLELLLEARPDVNPAHSAESDSRIWWDIEAKFCEDLSRPLDLGALERMARRSRHAIDRACRLAVGVRPMERFKELRLSYARALVLYSNLSMTEIALRVGYSRIQELSRDYHKKFGVVPTDDRRLGPDHFTPRAP